MSQTEGPESQIGGGVGDAAQAVLDGVDGLMHRHIAEVKLWDRKGTSKCNSGQKRLSRTGPEVYKRSPGSTFVDDHLCY